ncbi:hypothetical protein [Zoogloea sp.]|uniref:hypothetical protein n=1 Tax=Zoogloea sp. TaxID=49181 RepID=UPI001AC53414|nr:hypothetical protein [Zoogloea sp.]MBN8285365.1 hypothetical protein [Zoogloea sp.]
MATTFGVFTDAALTTPLAGTLDFAQAADGSTGPVVATVYIGSAAGTRVLRAVANPGVDPLVLTVTDSSAGGSPAADVTIALDETFVGRTPGASLVLGTQINGGLANAVAVYVRVEDSTGEIGLSTDLSLVLTLAEEL